MRVRIRTSSFLAIAALALASLFPLFVAHRYTPFLNDDSYITLAYAKNLAHGNGFVFNQPPATLGTTTPLLAPTIAGAARLLSAVALDRLAVWLTALCWLGIAWVFYAFRKEWGLED